MRKRLICFFTIFIFGILPVYAENIEGICGANAWWSLSDNCEVLTISGVGDISSYDWNNNEEYTESIKEVIIEKGITSIPTYAFRSCIKLEKITIPTTITDIGSSFDEDFSIKEVHISDLSAWCKINFSKNIANPLYYGGKLYINGEFSENIVIPEDVKNIGKFTFYNYDYLKSIEIPQSIKSIDVAAFYNCDGIKHIYYRGTEEEWKQITIGMLNSVLSNAKIFFNYKEPFAEAEIANVTRTDNSLKFISSVTVAGNPEIKAFGTTFIPLWLFEQGSKDVVTVEYDNANYDIQDGQTFGATLNNIPSNYKDKAIVGKSFIKYSDGTYKWSNAKSALLNNTNLQELEN